MSSVFGVLLVNVTFGDFCVVVVFFFSVIGVIVLGGVLLVLDVLYTFGVPPPRFFTLHRRRPHLTDIFFIFIFISIVYYYLFYYL
jgi:hypothetical protein